MSYEKEKREVEHKSDTSEYLIHVNAIQLRERKTKCMLLNRSYQDYNTHMYFLLATKIRTCHNLRL